MSYININTLEKVEAVDIMTANPNISFPNRGWSDEDILPYGYAELNFPVEHPMPGRYEKLEESTPVQIDGKWYVQFAIVPITDEEIRIKDSLKAAEVLALRDQVLRNSDWTQLPDVSLTQEEIQQWRVYRQAWRDITSQEGYPWDINIPDLITADESAA